MQQTYNKEYECCKWLPIELMPENKDAFTVFQHSIPGSTWQKGPDGLYRLRYNSADVAMVMQGLEIRGRKIYEATIACLSGLKQEHVG